jgi:hypothetical protein
VRKVKAEVQTSIDGFMASVDGRTDWMVWNWGPDWTWDPALRQCHVDLTTSSDCVLLSRKMATFISLSIPPCWVMASRSGAAERVPCTSSWNPAGPTIAAWSCRGMCRFAPPVGRLGDLRG